MKIPLNLKTDILFLLLPMLAAVLMYSSHTQCSVNCILELIQYSVDVCVYVSVCVCEERMCAHTHTHTLILCNKC